MGDIEQEAISEHRSSLGKILTSIQVQYTVINLLHT